MTIPTIDVDKVKELLDSYWKKWEPYDQREVTRVYIKSAKEDFLYRIQLYNDLLKRNDLSHFYPFRTILERLIKYEMLLTFEPKKREDWLHWDMTEGFKKLSEEYIDNNDMKSKTLYNRLNKLEEIFYIKDGTAKMDIKGIVEKSKIVPAKDTYDLYKAVCEYSHGSLLSAAMRNHGNHKNITREFSAIIMSLLETLGSKK
jgi:hypothetical protein